MPKQKTNIAAVRDIMVYSDFGALSQLFVIDALVKMAKAVSEADPATLDSGFVSGAAWQGVAKEIRGKLDAHLAAR